VTLNISRPLSEDSKIVTLDSNPFINSIVQYYEQGKTFIRKKKWKEAKQAFLMYQTCADAVHLYPLINIRLCPDSDPFQVLNSLFPRELESQTFW
jgi:hypothetical protein